MREVGRNDPCPCGSGAKHKRCCLDIGRSAMHLSRQAARRVVELGELARDVALPAWLDAFDRNIGPVPRFGGVPADEAEWLDTWLVCDEPLVEERTALELAEGASIDVRLRTSAICGWWARGDDFPLPATHWRFEEPVILHCPRRAFGELAEGALIVARGIELGSGHVALVGHPIVVDDEAVTDVLALLRRAPAAALCAALRWPESRTHTAEGEVVQHCVRFHELADPEQALALLRGAPRIREDTEVLNYWEDDVAFDVMHATGLVAGTPSPQAGVVWELCDEDRADPALIGEVTVSPAEGEISLSAPTPQRADLLLEALPMQLRGLIGALRSEDLDVRDVLPRCRRERMSLLA